MIIIGYQGIGKSTLARGGNGFIDLESSNFWVDNKRDSNWAKVYANIAVNLDVQGYNVFTSSHKEVREALKAHPWVCEPNGKLPVLLAVCFPVLELKDEWIARLDQRYVSSRTDKNYKAWRNAFEMYDTNIKDLMSEELPVVQIPIKSMDYNLEQLLAGNSIFRKGAGSI